MRTLRFTTVILLTLATIGGAAEMQFTVTNPGAVAQNTVARISLPVPQGAIVNAPAAVMLDGIDTPAQARLITSHPDGSVRRMMLSFPVDLAATETMRLELGAAETQAPASMLTSEAPMRLKTDAFDALVSDGKLQLLDTDGAVQASIVPFGPDLVGENETRLTVLESGPHYTWLRYNTEGEQWSGEVDVEIDRFGQIRLTHRLHDGHDGNTWTPDFGFDISAAGAKGTERTAHFMSFDFNQTFAEQSDLVAALTLSDGSALSVANPLALRQARGTLSVEADAAGVSIRSNRNEPVEEMETEGLMIQEGQWRVSQLLLAPITADEMACRCDSPIRTHADWTLYDAVYHTGQPLDAQSPVLRLAVNKYIEGMQHMSISGDDWGNMTSWSPLQSGQAINSMVRYNHCRYVWEQYFRSGDPRLLEIARDWSENYRNFSVYWGPNEEHYGGSRRGRAWRDKPGSPHGPGTYMVRHNTTLGWLTKGFAAFYLTWEETGDPRFEEAALVQARWSADNMTCLERELRSIGGVADYAKLYDYTGDSFHLQQAVRLWEEFQQSQMENLLFTQHGKEAVGDHLYIPDDAYGYKHQFVKPYMVQYGINSLPYLLEHTPQDQKLRDTIIVLSDWMATHRQPGGGWGYPHYLTAGMSWNNEYCHGIGLACKLEPKDIYLEAIRANIAPVVQMHDLYGELPIGLNPWEVAAGISKNERAERYHLAADRDPMPDYERGNIKFGQGPDNVVYFEALLRDYLQLASEESLLESSELLDKMKQLPTTIDPKVTGPVRVALAPTATFPLLVDFKSSTPMEATARITSLPEGVTPDQLEVRWNVARGRSQSPDFRLVGPLKAEGRATVRWRIGAWEGDLEITLTPGEEALLPGVVRYAEGPAEEGAPSDGLSAALLTLGIDLERLEGLDASAVRGLDGLIVAGEAHSRNLLGLADTPGQLIEFVRNGGRVALLQLQDSDHRPEYLPLALSLSDESSVVARITRPDHQIFGDPARVESLTGAVLFDSIIEADPGWEVLAVDANDHPAILEAQVGKGRLLIIQTSLDRYVAGTRTPPEGLSAADCGNVLFNVVHYLGGAG